MSFSETTSTGPTKKDSRETAIQALGKARNALRTLLLDDDAAPNGLLTCEHRAVLQRLQQRVVDTEDKLVRD